MGLAQYARLRDSKGEAHEQSLFEKTFKVATVFCKRI